MFFYRNMSPKPRTRKFHAYHYHTMERKMQYVMCLVPKTWTPMHQIAVQEKIHESIAEIGEELSYVVHLHGHHCNDSSPRPKDCVQFSADTCTFSISQSVHSASTTMTGFMNIPRSTRELALDVPWKLVGVQINCEGLVEERKYKYLRHNVIRKYIYIKTLWGVMLSHICAFYSLPCARAEPVSPALISGFFLQHVHLSLRAD